MPSAFAALKWMDGVQKAKQFQTALVSVLAPIQQRPQETVHAFGEHAAAPGTRAIRWRQFLGRFGPDLAQSLQSQQRDGCIQMGFPLLLQLLLFGPGARIALGIGFTLPQPAHRLQSGFAPAGLQWLQRLSQYRDVYRARATVQNRNCAFGFSQRRPLFTAERVGRGTYPYWERGDFHGFSRPGSQPPTPRSAVKKAQSVTVGSIDGLPRQPVFVGQLRYPAPRSIWRQSCQHDLQALLNGYIIASSTHNR